MYNKKMIGAIILLIVIFALATRFSLRKSTAIKEDSVRTQKVSVQLASNSKSITKETSYPAIVTGDQEVNITAKSAGTVSIATYGIGDRVNAGALLVRIDDIGNVLQSTEKGFKSIQIQQSQLTKEQAIESLALAEKNYKNLKEAYDEQEKHSSLTKTVSKAQVDSAKKQINIAEIQLDSAKLSLESNLDNHLITSPIAGVVTQKNVSVGDSVSIGQSIATISKSENIKVKFYVDQDQRAVLLRGQEVSALNAKNESLSFKITNIAETADQATKRFLIEAVPIDLSNEKLLSGTILTIIVKDNIKTQNENNLFLPLSAINVGQNESYIFIVDNNIVKKVTITIIGVVGENAEIFANISPETLIVTNGSKLVHDGETVSINQ